MPMYKVTFESTIVWQGIKAIEADDPDAAIEAGNRMLQQGRIGWWQAGSPKERVLKAESEPEQEF